MIAELLPLLFIYFAIPDPAHSHSGHTGTLHVTFDVGNQVILPCQPKVRSMVAWAYHGKPSADVKSLAFIVTDGKVNSMYSDRFSLTRTDDGRYNLALSDSRQTDAGLYICIEENGNGHSHYVQLALRGRQSCNMPSFLPLAEAVFVIVSWRDRRAGGRTETL